MLAENVRRLVRIVFLRNQNLVEFEYNQFGFGIGEVHLIHHVANDGESCVFQYQWVCFQTVQFKFVPLTLVTL